MYLLIFASFGRFKRGIVPQRHLLARTFIELETLHPSQLFAIDSLVADILIALPPTVSQLRRKFNVEQIARKLS